MDDYSTHIKCYLILFFILQTYLVSLKFQISIQVIIMFSIVKKQAFHAFQVQESLE